MVEKLTRSSAVWKYGAWLVPILVGLGLLVIIPDSPPPPPPTTTVAATTTRPPASTTTTTRPATTTSRPTTTTTTTVPSASGEDAALAAYIRSTPNPVIDRVWTITRTVDLSNLRDTTITATPSGGIRRTVDPTDRQSAPLIKLTGASNVTIRGLHLTAAAPCTVDHSLDTFGLTALRVEYDPLHETQHGISIDGGATRVTLDAVTVSNVQGDGIYLATSASDVTITNTNVACTGRGSVTNVGASNVAVTGGSFSGAGMWTFNIEPDLQAAVDNYRIDRVRVGYSVNWWLFSSGPYYSCKVTGVRVTNVTIDNQLWEWLRSTKCSTPPDITVTNCTPPAKDPRKVCKPYAG